MPNLDQYAKNKAFTVWTNGQSTDATGDAGPPSGSGAPTITISNTNSVLTVVIDESQKEGSQAAYWSESEIDNFYTDNTDGTRPNFYLSGAELDANRLAFEVEDHISAGDAGDTRRTVYHVNLGSSADLNDVSTVIKMGYGSDPGASSQEQATSVWDANYSAVYHMDTSLEDSTSNGNDLTNFGTADVAGLIARARQWDTVPDDYLTADDNASLDMGTVDFSIECRFKEDDTVPETLQQFYIKGDVGVSGKWYGWGTTATDNFIRAYIDDGTSILFSTGNTDVTDGAWHSLAATYDRDGVITIYLAGVSHAANSGSISGIGDLDNADKLYIGASNSGGTPQQFVDNGIIDEIRIHKNTLRNADFWLISHFSTLSTNWNGDNWLSWAAETTPSPAADAFPVPYAWRQRQNQNYDSGWVNQ